ncbi:MAG: Uma2 family endonuclease [Chloroflexi bacterium]|nr:Uma2 family endonuclease [Chloroflexota bacterium]
MATSLRWTVADLEALPQPLDDTRYEIIDGELYVTTQPHLNHQVACTNVVAALHGWSERTGAGVVAVAPGIIFSLERAVAPDAVWFSKEHEPLIVGEDGKLHGAPELIIEVLSPGSTNRKRDQEIKLRLYSTQGVREYWIIDWQDRSVAVYRREQAVLQLAATLFETDVLESPLLPGFSCPVSRLFAGL